MLAFQKTSYAGFGMFVSDSQVLLDGEGLEGLVRKTISIKPRVGVGLRDLGWDFQIFRIFPKWKTATLVG